MVLQDRTRVCYPVAWLACTISIPLALERPIICNLAEIVALEPFADSISFTFESACLLDKKNKKKKKRNGISYLVS